MLTCGLCRTKLVRGTHYYAFSGATSVLKHVENLRYIAGKLGSHPVLSERGQETLHRLNRVADEGDEHFTRLHATAHGLWRGPAADWPQVRRWIADADAALEPWMRRALAAGN